MAGDDRYPRGTWRGRCPLFGPIVKVCGTCKGAKNAKGDSVTTDNGPRLFCATYEIKAYYVGGMRRRAEITSNFESRAFPPCQCTRWREVRVTSNDHHGCKCDADDCERYFNIDDVKLRLFGHKSGGMDKGWFMGPEGYALCRRCARKEEKKARELGQQAAYVAIMFALADGEDKTV
jgi:hypothetical protein